MSASQLRLNTWSTVECAPAHACEPHLFSAVNLGLLKAVLAQSPHTVAVGLGYVFVVASPAVKKLPGARTERQMPQAATRETTFILWPATPTTMALQSRHCRVRLAQKLPYGPHGCGQARRRIHRRSRCRRMGWETGGADPNLSHIFIIGFRRRPWPVVKSSECLGKFEQAVNCVYCQPRCTNIVRKAPRPGTC